MDHSQANQSCPWSLDPAQTAARCADFIAGTVEAAGREGVVLGLSGGIDSAVAAAVAVRALGPGHVHALCMPHASSDPRSLADALEVARFLGLTPSTVPITPMVDAFLAACPDADPVRRGNIMARARMILLFDQSQVRRGLVLGTGNRAEWLLGYTTLHGDAACGLSPLGQLYKTEVRLLAAYLGLPDQVLDKMPSADLWVGQADEDELGFTYAEADRILHHYFDEGLQMRQLVALGLAASLVERVLERVRRQAFKRHAPPVCDFGRPHPETAEHG
jgi:NAD+ synthase